MRDYVATLLAPRDRNKTLTALAEPVTAPHDGGALFPDDSGVRKSGHATAYVSRQYLGSRGQVGNGIVAAATARARAKGIAFRALVADCFYGPSESRHFIAGLDRAATPYVAAVEPRKNCPMQPADMAGIVSLYGLGGRTEQDDKPVKHELVLADFQVRSGQAIQRDPPIVSDPPSSEVRAPSCVSPYLRRTRRRRDSAHHRARLE
ncbi:hypothetical protein ABT124_24280 [Streptomyces sp. NPDC001982]|uniref:hypothetical protein n=1 Tax=Streptomyces sp. NPDC001982 TaxID=3154405 RepID=UPI00331AD1B5